MSEPIDLTAFKNGLAEWGAYWQRQSELVLAAFNESFNESVVTTGERSYAVTHPDHPGEVGEVPTAVTDPSEGWRP